VYGFALQEARLPFDTPETVPQAGEASVAQFPSEECPHLAGLATEHILLPATTTARSSRSGSTSSSTVWSGS